MRQVIKGKHLAAGSRTVNMRTGKETKSTATMMMLPAKEGTCEQCAVAHEEREPHNAQSMFYQYHFYNEKGRWPNWIDAMSHCKTEVQEIWTLRLEEQGVDVKGGKVNPERRGK